MLELEVLRVVRNAGLPTDVANEYLDEFALIAVGDDLIDEAIALDPVLGGADSVHIAAAMRLGADRVTIVTHDAQMARAAASLGFEVLDPVTYHPGRPAVVSQPTHLAARGWSPSWADVRATYRRRPMSLS